VMLMPVLEMPARACTVAATGDTDAGTDVLEECLV
jgi:hypothetical protein